MPRPCCLNLFLFSQAVKFGLSVTGLTLVVLANLGLNPSQARNRPSSDQGQCQQSLTELMPPLLEALPSYTNRVMQRSQIGG
ncbi:hypothetical protein IQ217_14985, partial [Synechocystis salina LEGE 00031]|nr:hypothetical protein [Synechocystis salina LEGE 00031]